MGFEIDFIRLIQENLMSIPIICNIISFFTLFGESLITVGIVGFLYWSYDKEFGKYVGINVLCTGVTNSMVKNIFNRKRPYFVDDTIKCLKPVSKGDLYDVTTQGYSFPSGHSSNAMSLFSSLYLFLKKKLLLIIAIILVSLVGISRFCLGVHYPTDVLTGWLLGFIMVVLISFFQKRIKDIYLYPLLIIIFLPGIFYAKSKDYFSCYGLMIGFLLALLFEKKYVNFDNTNNIYKGIIRVILGSLIFVLVNYLLKLCPVDHNLFIVFRYAISIFIVIGVYPLLFKYLNI